MKVKCTTLEQINKIVEVEGWASWQHTDYKGCLNYISKFGYVCVKITYEGEYGNLDSWNECSNNEFIDFVDSKYFNNTIPVNEIKYELESNVICDTCVTSCKHKKNTMVGSVGCSKCEYNCGDDKTNQTVQCSWQEKESKEMKRLDISLKIQPDGKTVVAECTHIDEDLRGKGVLASKDGYKLRSDYGLGLNVDSMLLYVRGEDKSRDFLVSSSTFYTPQQAQEYVKIMNELVDEVNNPKTNWSKVEEGAEVRVNDYIAKFHSYVPKLNKVIIIFGESVNAVDEDRVELV